MSAAAAQAFPLVPRRRFLGIGREGVDEALERAEQALEWLPPRRRRVVLCGFVARH